MIFYIQRQRKSHKEMVGGAHSQYSQILHQLGGWHTNWKITIIADVLPEEWEFWAPHQAPQSRCPASGGGAPRASGFEGQQGLSARAPQDWGNRDSILEGCTQSLMHTGTQGKKQWLHISLGQTYPLVLERLPRKWGAAVAHFCGEKDTGGRANTEYSSAWALLEAAILTPRPGPTQQPVGSSAGTPQHKQATGWGNGPAHQQTGCLVILSQQPPQNTPLHKSLCSTW